MIEIYTKDRKQTFESTKDSGYNNALKDVNRKDGPAIISYYESGNIEYEEYYINGKINRKDGPAVIYYYENGNLKYKEWYINEKLYRKDGPAVIRYYENEKVQYRSWHINGKLHREDKPAIISYYENSNVEREAWYLNNKLNREDGPAFIEYKKNGNIKNEIYYLNGKEYSFKDWKKKVKIKEIELQSQAELMKQMAKDKVPYKEQEYYISTIGNKPIVYTIKESKIFESFKESYNK